MTQPYPTTPAPTQPDPSAPADGAAATDPATTTAPAGTESSAAPAKAAEPAAGDFVHIRHDNGRGTVTDTTALVVRRHDVADVADGKPAGSHAEYDVVPVTTMRVRAEHLVDDVEG